MDVLILSKFTVLIITCMAELGEVYCTENMQLHLESTSTAEGEYLDYGMTQSKFDQMKIPRNQTLEVRLPSNTLLKYTSYKDVSILHFRMPSDTYRAMFTFKAFDESKGAFQRKCKSRDVTLHLKAKSYPVISPENITFPENFLKSEQRFKTYSLQFKSDEVQQRIIVDGPQIGNWFAVAFVSWTDPNNDRIEQQGLAASCDTLLLAEMSVSRFHPIIINTGQVLVGTLTSATNRQKAQNNTGDNTQTAEYTDIEIDGAHILPGRNSFKNSRNSSLAGSHSNENPKSTSSSNYKGQGATKQESQMSPSESVTSDDSSLILSTSSNEIIYKFYVPQSVGEATARISFSEVCRECPNINFRIQANAFPTGRLEDERNYIHNTVLQPNQTTDQVIEFNVQPTTWHYALFTFIKEPVGIKNNLNRPSNSATSNITLRQLVFEFQMDYYELLDETAEAASDTEIRDSDEVNTIDGKPSNDTEFGASYNAWFPTKFRKMDFYPLLRQTYREFFMFDYDLVPDENGTVPTLLNLTAGFAAGFAFSVGEVYDIGGTLTFAVSMKLDTKESSEEYVKASPIIPTTSERGGVLAEKLVGGPLDSSDEGDPHKKGTQLLPRSNQTIIVCMHHGEPGEPTWPDKCRYGDRLLPSSSVVNNTDSTTSTGLIHVPFPESGQWYITMGLYCHGAETAARASVIESVKEFVKKYAYMLDSMKPPCACAHNFIPYRKCVHDIGCLSGLNETETLKIKECLMDSKCTSNHSEMTEKFEVHHKLATEQPLALDNCSSSVVFTISSSPCVAGRCGRFGRCYHYMSGGFVFSTCVCMKGYRGWDCADDSQVPSSISILMASLLLTLSNLLFLPSIYMAMNRKFYTEGVIYFFAMFFSIFYHACDSGEDEYSFCLVKIGVLQFCDFYCGLLAIWVTLVAMSHLRQHFVSLLHMFGAILLAFGTELNKQSLWVFLAPALIGICLISASWGMRCYKSRKWFPARKYLTVYMPLGAVLVMVGLVCYAFLQTKQNYHIVHSIWHMVMALSILCLLPSPNSFIPKC